MTPLLMDILELALVAALGMMAGAMLYTSYVEIPARARLEPAGQVRNWQSVFPIASGFLKPFGIGLLPLFLIVGIGTADWFWALAAIPIMSVQPFTALFLSKTNAELLEAKPDEATQAIAALVAKWGSLHNIRTVLACASFVLVLIGHFKGM